MPSNKPRLRPGGMHYAFGGGGAALLQMEDMAR